MTIRIIGAATIFAVYVTSVAAQPSLTLRDYEACGAIAIHIRSTIDNKDELEASGFTLGLSEPELATSQGYATSLIQNFPQIIAEQNGISRSELSTKVLESLIYVQEDMKNKLSLGPSFFLDSFTTYNKILLQCAEKADLI